MIATAGIDELKSPDWLLAGFDLQNDRYHLARVDRETYHGSTFLDHRIQPLPAETSSLSGVEIDALLPATAIIQASWIFHTGFCGSTLLANCLDHPGTTLVLREPLVLSRLAQRLRDSSDPDSPAMHHLIRRVIGLCERSYPGDACIIKPSNFANALVPRLLLPDEQSGRPTRKAILMSCSLDALLLSILKKKAEAESSLPDFLRALLQDSDYLEHADVPDPAGLDLLQQSVLFWHCQRYFLQQQLTQVQPGRLMTLSMERFLAEPETVLNAASEFLGLGLSQQFIEQTIASGAFRKHSKQSSAGFGPADYKLEQQATLARFADELAQVKVWAKPVLSRLPISALDIFEEATCTVSS